MKDNNLKGGEKEMELMIPVKHFACLRCKHVWQPRPGATDYPRMCPKCKSLRWDKPLKPQENNELK